MATVINTNPTPAAPGPRVSLFEKASGVEPIEPNAQIIDPGRSVGGVALPPGKLLAKAIGDPNNGQFVDWGSVMAKRGVDLVSSGEDGTPAIIGGEVTGAGSLGRMHKATPSAPAQMPVPQQAVAGPQPGLPVAKMQSDIPFAGELQAAGMLPGQSQWIDWSAVAKARGAEPVVESEMTGKLGDVDALLAKISSEGRGLEEQFVYGRDDAASKEGGEDAEEETEEAAPEDDAEKSLVSALRGLEDLAKSLRKAKYESKKRVGDKWVYKYKKDSGTSEHVKLGNSNRGYRVHQGEAQTNLGDGKWRKIHSNAIASDVHEAVAQAHDKKPQPQQTSLGFDDPPKPASKKFELPTMHHMLPSVPSIADLRSSPDLQKQTADNAVRTVGALMNVFKTSEPGSKDRKAASRTVGDKLDGHLESVAYRLAASGRSDLVAGVRKKLSEMADPNQSFKDRVSPELIGRFRNRMWEGMNAGKKVARKAKLSTSEKPRKVKKSMEYAEVDMAGRTLRKGGLHSFRDAPPSMPDEYLHDYWLAFVEEAFEHESGEAVHTQGAPVSRLENIARAIVSEGVLLVGHNPALARAFQSVGGCTKSTVMAAIVDLGLMKPDSEIKYHGDFEEAFGLEGYAQAEPMAYSFAARGVQEEMAPVTGVARVNTEPENVIHLVKADSENPFEVLHTRRAKEIRALWNVDESALDISVRDDCPVHGGRDMTKSMNLWNPMQPCICKGKPDAYG